jgi:hypothetical protein
MPTKLQNLNNSQPKIIPILFLNSQQTQLGLLVAGCWWLLVVTGYWFMVAGAEFVIQTIKQIND